MSTVTQVQASLAQARDAQLARVVAMVDALPDRGEADALIAPLRPRLAVLRPVRPAGFKRVLFSPLDPVIVSMAEWRRCGVGVPRPALAPLGNAVQAAMPGFADSGDSGIAGSVAGGFAGQASALWTAADAVIDGLALPAGWEAAGLQPAEFASVKAVVAAVMHEAVAIEGLSDCRGLVEDTAIWPILARSKECGTVALDTMVSVLLARLPCPDRVVALAAEACGNDGVSRRVTLRLASAVAMRGDTLDVRDAAKEAARVSALLAALETGAPPERRAQLDAIRREADGQCRRSFGQAVTRALALVPNAGPGLDDEVVAALESSARDLRRLAAATRGLGSAEHYDLALAETAETLGEMCTTLDLVDRVRLLEILAGPERALALLSGPAAGRQRPVIV